MNDITKKIKEDLDKALEELFNESLKVCLDYVQNNITHKEMEARLKLRNDIGLEAIEFALEKVECKHQCHFASPDCAECKTIGSKNCSEYEHTLTPNQ